MLGTSASSQPLEAHLEWGRLRAQMARTARSSAWIRAGEWALGTLERALGSDWPRRAEQSDGPLPVPLGLAAHHVIAYAEVLELALYLHLLEGCRGYADVVRDLARDPRAGRARHTAIQLETAACALRLGWEVELEPRDASGDTPSDVRFLSDSACIDVEAKALLPADATMRHHRSINEVLDRLLLAASRLGLILSGELHSIPIEEELVEIEEWIAQTAPLLRADGWVPPFQKPAFNLTVVSDHSQARGSLRGPASRDDTPASVCFRCARKGRSGRTIGSELVANGCPSRHVADDGVGPASTPIEAADLC